MRRRGGGSGKGERKESKKLKDGRGKTTEKKNTEREDPGKERRD